MKVIIVDDELLAIEVLEILISRIDEVEIVGKYTNPHEAIVDLKNLDVDVIFLDMEMGSVHGLQFAEEIMGEFPRIEIVFVTGHAQFALEAFEVNAIDYLLKPVNFNRLNKTIEKLQEKLLLYNQKSDQINIKKQGSSIQAMGSFKLFDTERNEVKWRTKKVKELFAYLWQHREKVTTRSRIIEELWGGLPEDRAATLLHTTVYQVRKAIRDIGYENPVKLVNDQYMLNVEFESDFDQLRELLKSHSWNRYSINKTIELYKGDYMEEENYRWTHSEQHAVKQSFLTYLEGYVASEENDIALICLAKMSQLEPYNEQYVYMLLDYYGRTKKTEKMIHLFQEFKRNWIEELGIDLPEEVVDVYEKYLM